MTHTKGKLILCLTIGVIGVTAFVCAANAAGQKNLRGSSTGVSKAAGVSCRDGKNGQSKAARPDSADGKQGQGDTIPKGSETILPDYVYDGTDPEERLVCVADAQWMAKGTRQGFSVTAVKILGSYQQGSKLKLFARVENSEYSLCGSRLSDLGGSNMPAAVTFTLGTNGTYQMEKYEVPQDGTFYAPSIRKFCTQPVTGEVIEGLAEKVIASDSDSEALTRLQYQHLANHLHRHGISDAVLLDPYNKVAFSLKDYYK